MYNVIYKYHTVYTVKSQVSPINPLQIERYLFPAKKFILVGAGHLRLFNTTLFYSCFEIMTDR